MSKKILVDVGDLRIALTMLQTLYDLLHEDQPECCGAGAELVVETGGQTRNITKHVPVVIQHLLPRVAEEETSEAAAYRKAAEEIHNTSVLQVDGQQPFVRVEDDGGAWVSAWVGVENSQLEGGAS